MSRSLTVVVTLLGLLAGGAVYGMVDGARVVDLNAVPAGSLGGDCNSVESFLTCDDINCPDGRSAQYILQNECPEECLHHQGTCGVSQGYPCNVTSVTSNPWSGCGGS